MKTNSNDKTGLDWGKFLNIEVVNPIGWDSIEDFNRVPINRNEFMLRAANSVIIPPKNKSRRDMAQFRQNLMNK